MSIFIKDNQTGNIHEYGTNEHDALHISGDGSCLYYENLQNGDGSMCGGYSFVMEDGKTPEESETADAMHAMCYFNIGGFRTEVEERQQGEFKCVTCKYRSCEITEKPCNKCSRAYADLYEVQNCGADMKCGVVQKWRGDAKKN